jgi:1-aminocyclopropane-1-carboxylate deaminase/D-cysteine desulfhydrase-like pyridoxal-dependent ACC family enzyme
MSFQQPDASFPYQPPAWAEGKLTNVPTNGRLHLANLPTPIHLIGTKADGGGKNSILSRLKELNIKLYIKRDDATGGAELGGNKIRKLEFLLADALAKGCDSVVTIGGEQSNHCRATAAASRMVGMSPHLILRTRRADSIDNKTDEMGWNGNILFDRMVGSTIYTCTPGEVRRLVDASMHVRYCSVFPHQCCVAIQYTSISTED